MPRSRSPSPEGRQMPRSPSAPPFTTRRPGRAFISDVSSRSREPATISGWATIASRIARSAGARLRRGSSAGTASGSARRAYARATAASGNANVCDAAPVDRGPQPLRRRLEGAGDDGPDGSLHRVARIPVVLQGPVAQARQEQHRGVVAGAHVADGTGPLTVAGEPRRGERVKRRTLAPAGEERLRQSRPTEDRLERADVDVLARMGARHQGDLRRRQAVVAEPAGLGERDERERLDA